MARESMLTESLCEEPVIRDPEVSKLRQSRRVMRLPGRMAHTRRLNWLHFKSALTPVAYTRVKRQ